MSSSRCFLILLWSFRNCSGEEVKYIAKHIALTCKGQCFPPQLTWTYGSGKTLTLYFSEVRVSVSVENVWDPESQFTSLSLFEGPKQSFLPESQWLFNSTNLEKRWYNRMLGHPYRSVQCWEWHWSTPLSWGWDNPSKNWQLLCSTSACDEHLAPWRCDSWHLSFLLPVPTFEPFCRVVPHPHA